VNTENNENNVPENLAQDNQKENLLVRIKNVLQRRKKIVIAVIAVIIILAGVLFVCSRVFARKRTGAETQSRQQTATVQKMDLSNSISVTGTIASADSRSVSAGVNGVEIKAVNVNVGDYVNAGDTIITLDSSSVEEELETAQDSYSLSVTKTNKSLQDAADSVVDAQDAYTDGISEQAALVADAKGTYNEAAAKEKEKKTAYENAQAATENAKNAYEEANAQKSALQTELQAAEAVLNSANETLKNAENAYETAEATDKNSDGNIDAAVYKAYTDAKAEQEAAQAAYDQAKQNYDKIEQAKTAYEEAQKAEEQAKQDYETAAGDTSGKYAQYEKAVETQEETNEKNADNIEESQYNYSITSQESANNLKSQKNQVQDIEEKLGECVVTAPISGVITSLSVAAGDTYEGGEIFVIQDMTTFIVEATVDEYDISDIAKDMEAVVKTDATDDEQLAGVVTYVAPTPESSGGSQGAASSGSATYAIQITLSDSNDRLRIGMTAKTSILLESAKDVLAVPYDCIQTDESGNQYVEVVSGMTKGAGEKPEGVEKSDAGTKNAAAETAQTTKIYVETGLESDYYVEVKSDELSEGMMVLIPTAEPDTSAESGSADKDGASLLDGLTGGNGGGMPNGDGGGMPGGGGGNGGGGNGGGPGGF
jgi:multidrug efflux pump subunit AcrA (membrane-fusion protein)